jgi:hypothetical protein
MSSDPMSTAARPAELAWTGFWLIYERVGADPVARMLPHAPDAGTKVSIRRTDWDGAGFLTVLCAGDDWLSYGAAGLVLTLPMEQRLLEYRDGAWHSLTVPLASVYAPS